MDYIGRNSPITTGIEDNIQILQETVRSAASVKEKKS
jgi:hypothetical protein